MYLNIGVNVISLHITETSRQSDWDSVVACHRGLCQTTTWNYQKGCMGKHRLLHERFKDYEKHKNTTCQVRNESVEDLKMICLMC